MHSDLLHGECITIAGAREHNLKNLTVKIPLKKMVVVTGISGSGKSSLIFDTLYNEGHRRYMDTLETSYMRMFASALERPDVDKIEGLQSVIGIKQRLSGSGNMRATVGTVAEVHALLRLLYARVGVAYSHLTGERMTARTEEEIVKDLWQRYAGGPVTLLAPLIRARKGHHEPLFRKLYKQGFEYVRVDGALQELSPTMRLDRYSMHDIEVVVDALRLEEDNRGDFEASVREALTHGDGTLLLIAPKNTLHYASRKLTDPTSGLSYREPMPMTFSFNASQGYCTTCLGFGELSSIAREVLVPDLSLSLKEGAIMPLGAYKSSGIFLTLEVWLHEHGYKITTPFKKISKAKLTTLLYGGGKNDMETLDSGGLVGMLLQGASRRRLERENLLTKRTCPACKGMRLQPEALHFRIHGKNIAELSYMSMEKLVKWFDKVEGLWSDRERKIGGRVVEEIRKRLRLLLDMGLGYLHLYRPVQSLSGGEVQRIHLATQIGTQLVGVLYILDEPSIGLHQRDNGQLIHALKTLRDMGNTVVVIEHDKETMLAADYLLEIGPGAGQHGGQLVAAGTPEEFLAQPSATASYLKDELEVPSPPARRKGNGKHIHLKGCKGHNLKGIDMSLPLGKLICVTGVSGSGKSTLIHRTLLPLLKRHFGLLGARPLPYSHVAGLEHLSKVIEVDQGAIGRTPRSSPATYTNLFGPVRALFAQLPESRIREYSISRFSFNVKGGRCDVCDGSGLKVVEMEFMTSVRIMCERCGGKRYNRQTLEVRYRGKSIADVLALTVDAAADFFAKHPLILAKLHALQGVGLGYLTLGQHATTLSGGESQRVKLSRELAKRATGDTLYLLDEPTTGLHFQDVSMLLGVLQQIVEKGNTVLVIEHNMDVIKAADWVIDLGPEAGDGGGTLVAAGTPEMVAEVKASHTGHFLRAELGLT